MDFAQLLKTVGAVADKNAFSLWESGRINTKECWNRFLKNNRVKPKDAPEYDSVSFQYYLAGLGYKRLWWRVPKEDIDEAIDTAQPLQADKEDRKGE